jgi:hypothetical protein
MVWTAAFAYTYLKINTKRESLRLVLIWKSFMNYVNNYETD